MFQRILVVADARSPHVIGWVKHLKDMAPEVVVASTFSTRNWPEFEIPLVSILSPWSRLERTRSRSAIFSGITTTRASERLSNVALSKLRIADAHVTAKSLRGLMETYKPDLVHSMRTGYEGIAVSLAIRGLPYRPAFINSIWGNDFTLFAQISRPHRKLVEQVMRDVDGLHTDCIRDIALAREFGLPGNAPTVVAPSGGGVNVHHSLPCDERRVVLQSIGLEVDDEVKVVVYPRGIRSYVKTETFVEAVERLAPDRRFVAIGVGLAGNERFEAAARRCSGNLHLTPPLAHQTIIDLLRISVASVSPSLYDGTPNSLLEAMACGAVPIVSPLDSVKEWVGDDDGALFAGPEDAALYAEHISRVIEDDGLCASFIQRNREVVRQRASTESARASMKDLYDAVLRR